MNGENVTQQNTIEWLLWKHSRSTQACCTTTDQMNENVFIFHVLCRFYFLFYYDLWMIRPIMMECTYTCNKYTRILKIDSKLFDSVFTGYARLNSDPTEV